MLDKIDFSKRMGLFKLLGVSFKIYLKCFAPIVVIALLIHTPINIVNLMMPVPDLLSLMENLDYGMIKYISISGIMEFFLAPISTMAIAHLCKDFLLGKTSGPIHSLNVSFSNWLSLIGVTLIFLLILMVTLLLPVFTIYFSVVYNFFIYAIVLSRQKGFNALRYSAFLVKKNWWRVFLYCIVINLLLILFMAFCIMLFLPVQDTTLASFLTSTAYSVTGAYIICFVTVWYLNIEKIKVDALR